MEPRSDDQLLQPAEAESHVGVDEDGMEGNKDDVSLDRPLSEAQHVDRQEGEARVSNDIDQVQPIIPLAQPEPKQVAGGHSRIVSVTVEKMTPSRRQGGLGLSEAIQGFSPAIRAWKRGLSRRGS